MPSETSSTVECPPGNGPHCFDHGPKCCHCGVCDHSTCGWKPRHDFVSPEHCDYCAKAFEDQLKGISLIPRPSPEEPPPTPEEEEEAAACIREDGCDRPVGTCEHGCWAAADELTRLGQEMEEPPPPQPERRPPYAVAYSVGGHLYELALPGDATAQAVDGALIITHSLGQVAGIVRIMPMQKEAS